MTIIRHTIFFRNRAREDGGALRIGVNEANVRLSNSILYENSAGRDGSAIIFTHCIAQFRSCIFWGNEGLAIGRSRNSGVALNTFDMSFCNFQGDLQNINLEDDEILWGEGNINEDPLFADPDNGDYHLTADSPCIDTGDPEADLDPDGTRADMGAYYFHQLDIDVNPVMIEFPAIEWGEWDSTAVNITNTGGTDLSIIEILYPLHVTHVFLQYVDPDELPIVIQPQDTLTLYAYNHPEPRAMRQSGVTIVSDDPDEPEIEIQMIAEVLSVGDEPSYPDRYSLSTPYPNPFNSTVTLDYNLSTSAQTSILVYDLSGRMVDSLVNGQIPASSHTVSWAAEGFTSGMYFVKMESAGFSGVRKVILTR